VADTAFKPVRSGLARRLLNSKVLIAFVMVVLLFVVGEIITPGFTSFSHVMTVLQAAFFLGLMALSLL